MLSSLGISCVSGLVRHSPDLNRQYDAKQSSNTVVIKSRQQLSLHNHQLKHCQETSSSSNHHENLCYRRHSIDTICFNDVTNDTADLSNPESDSLSYTSENAETLFQRHYQPAEDKDDDRFDWTAIRLRSMHKATDETRCGADNAVRVIDNRQLCGQSKKSRGGLLTRIGVGMSKHNEWGIQMKKENLKPYFWGSSSYSNSKKVCLIVVCFIFCLLFLLLYCLLVGLVGEKKTALKRARRWAGYSQLPPPPQVSQITPRCYTCDNHASLYANDPTASKSPQPVGSLALLSGRRATAVGHMRLSKSFANRHKTSQHDVFETPDAVDAFLLVASGTNNKLRIARLCTEKVNRTEMKQLIESDEWGRCQSNKYNGCFKLVTKSYRVLAGTGKVNLVATVVTRDCAVVPVGLGVGCRDYIGGSGVRRTVCYCRGDYCNAAAARPSGLWPIGWLGDSRGGGGGGAVSWALKLLVQAIISCIVSRVWWTGLNSVFAG